MTDKKGRNLTKGARTNEKAKIKVSGLFEMFDAIKKRQLENNLQDPGFLGPVIQEIARLLSSCHKEVKISYDSFIVLMSGAEFMEKAGIDLPKGTKIPS